MLAYIDFPSWITPEVFGFLKLPQGHFLNLFRWYGLMYIIGIMISYFQSMYILKHDNLPTLNKKIIDDYYFWAIIGLVFGGRIFSCIVYDFEYYSKHLHEIIIPFRDGQFIGFQGMAFHGAAIGVFLTILIFVKLKKLNFRELCDLTASVIPLGYTFGRIANFINQELWGKITGSPIGMLFSNADKVPIKLKEVQTVISKLGWQVNETANIVMDANGNEIKNVLGKVIDESGFISSITGVNLPRHPSQLYEAFFEGIVLFLIVWFPARKFKPFKGFLAPVYIAGYAIARIIIEFFRQPDSQFMNIEKGKYTGYIIGSLTMGQILSWLMLFFAIGLGVYFYFLSKKDELKPLKINSSKNKKKRRKK